MVMDWTFWKLQATALYTVRSHPMAGPCVVQQSFSFAEIQAASFEAAGSDPPVPAAMNIDATGQSTRVANGKAGPSASWVGQLVPKGFTEDVILKTMKQNVILKTMKQDGSIESVLALFLTFKAICDDPLVGNGFASGCVLRTVQPNQSNEDPNYAKMDNLSSEDSGILVIIDVTNGRSKENRQEIFSGSTFKLHAKLSGY